jgi:hypothetical protein
MAEARGRHELAVAAHLDDATVGESPDDGERSWAILGRCTAQQANES